jgi:hypothetical protein
LIKSAAPVLDPASSTYEVGPEDAEDGDHFKTSARSASAADNPRGASGAETGRREPGGSR